MKINQKKTIYWSAVITIFIIFTLYLIFEAGNRKENIFDEIFASIFASFIMLVIPFLIGYRLLFGKINVDKDFFFPTNIPFVVFLLCGIVLIYLHYQYDIVYFSYQQYIY